MHINNVIANKNNVCTYCSLFIPFRASILLTKIYLKFVLAIKATVIVNYNLDYYRYIINNSYFCKYCCSIIIEKKISKFGFANCIYILFYQKYLDIFSDLTLIKEAFIACIYHVIFVIKLKPNKTSLTTLYY